MGQQASEMYLVAIVTRLHGNHSNVTNYFVSGHIVFIFDMEFPWDNSWFAMTSPKI